MVSVMNEGRWEALGCIMVNNAEGFLTSQSLGVSGGGGEGMREKKTTNKIIINFN